MADEQTAAAAQPVSAPSSSAPASPAPQAAPAAPATSSAPPTPSSSASAPAQASPPADKPARPAWTPESYWDAEKSAVKPEFADHYKDLATFKALEESRKLTLPKTPDEYQAQLPKDFQLPQGLEYKIDPANPIMTQAKQLMHDIDNGRVSGQAAFEKMIGLYAGAQVSNEQMLKGARDAEVGKLGPAGPARVTAVQSFLEAQLGAEHGKFMGNMLVTAQHVEGFEKLMSSFRNQGAGNFSQAHRQPNEPARATTEQYNKMTFSERKEYAARFPQSNGQTH